MKSFNDLFLGKTNYGVDKCLTNAQYEEFKTHACNHSPIRKAFNASDVSVKSSNQILVAGQKLAVSSDAKTDMLKILGLSKKVEGNFNEQLGEKFTSAVIDILRKSLASSGARFTFVVSKSGEILRILNAKKNGNNYMRAESFFKLFESTVTDLDIDSLSFSSSTGNIAINLKTSKETLDLGGIEKYKTGISFNRLSDSVLVNPYLFRLVCTNGIITKLASEAVELRTQNVDDISYLINKLNEFKKSEYCPLAFGSQMKKAKETQASMAEYNLALDQLLKLDADPNALETLFNYSHVLNEFEKKGIIIEEMPSAKLKNLRSPKKISDLVEILSDIGSHQSLNDPESAKILSGNLLFKKIYDAENLLQQVF